ncbi:disease resistance protein At4g27190 [Hevea brasiliensis]|uniref:disease resistance protein At4g27190 n=1 Tax=Hevea brasiliensis TaxID=3981 RepID=UPI0025D880BC|nr:disease resistance protein At4g27190 [Hevea brasiliensis]XP_057989715.1 disease resistance protein At4g27190 [Hevea brasiliensis]
MAPTSVDAIKIIQVDVLSEQESWSLLKRNAGDAIESSPTMNSVAKEICKECGGLPIAIVTIGRAMRGKDLEEWKETALELKKAKPLNIEGVNDKVYNCLKLSYDYLEEEEAKFMFWFCCLFPEDFDILIEDLVRYGIGLGIFEDVRIQEPRNRARSIINNLKEACLLLTSNWEGCIKMHDVVRDVAKSMTSEMYFVKAGGEKLEEWPNIENLKRYTAISIMQNQILEYPASWDYPNLQTLLLRDNSNSQLPMPEGVLKGMKTLKVLANISACRNLELAIGHLTNLRTLILHDYIVRDTNALGELKLLEILSFKGSRFTVPPSAVRKLTSLKLVDLENCSHPPHTDSILPFNVVSKLSKVQELYMWPPRTSLFDRFGVFEWFSITELKSLPCLTAFAIVINNFNRIPVGFSFPDLKVFKMSIGEGGFLTKQNYLNLCGPIEDPTMVVTKLGCIKPLLPRTNYLSLSSY